VELPKLERYLMIEVAFKYWSFLLVLLTLRFEVIDGEFTEESGSCERFEVII
jgi:hypothetical protein